MDEVGLERWKIDFGVAKSLRYHAYRRDFWDRLDIAAKILTGISGAGVLLTIIRSSAALATYFAVAVALTSVLDVVLRFGKRARKHDGLYRDFSLLAQDIAAKEKATLADVSKWRKRRIAIEANEPGVACCEERQQGRGEMPIAKKALDRISEGVKRYRTILAQAKKRDVSESDTVVIIGDMLADVLGYEKYIEVSTEFAIKGTYVDLAVKVGKEVYFLVEAKAIGVELKDIHVRQVVDYGANQGVEWAVVTNGIVWRVYRIEFKKPISHSLIAEVNLLDADSKDAGVAEFFSNLCKEGFAKSQMEEFYEQHQATNSHTLAAVLLSDQMLNHLRLGLRRLFPNVNVDAKSLASSLRNEVLKRELVEGEDSLAAAALVKKVARAAERRKKAGKVLLVPPAPSSSAAPAPAAAATAASMAIVKA